MDIAKDNTLTVGHLMKALKDGRVTEDMPIGVVVHGMTLNGRTIREYPVYGVVSHEIHTYKDGSRVFVAHTETVERVVASDPGESCVEVGL